MVNTRAFSSLWSELPLLTLLGAVTLLAIPSSADAQSANTSAIRGTVRTEDGAAVVGASLTLSHSTTGSRYEQLSDDGGRFAFRLLPPGGPYTLVVSGLGFGTVTEEDIALRMGEVAELDILVEQQAISLEGLRVELDRDPIFRIPQVGPATFVDRTTVTALPLLSRDLTELSVLSPLVKTSDNGFSVAGQNDRYNAVLIDGSLTKDVFGLTASGTPGGRAGARLIPIEAVAQYEVLVAPYDTRLSGFTGGVMNAVTRTGTNDWEGSAFAYARTAGLTGDLTLPGFSVDPSGVSRDLFGFSLGGPLIRDRLHIFVAGEFEDSGQPPNGFNLGRDTPILSRVSEQTITDMSSLFSEAYGLEIGDASAYVLERQVGNLFARLDWQLSPQHRFSLRHLFAGADDASMPNRTSFESYELSSNTVDLSSRSNATTLEFLSTLGTWSNEARLTVQKVTDASTPLSTYPQIEVVTHSSFEGVGLNRKVRMGSRYLSQADDLKQTSLQFTDDLSAEWDNHTVTMGVAVSAYDIDQLYLPGSNGYYRYGSLTDVAQNTPLYFERTLVDSGVPARVAFDVMEFAAHIQDEVRATQSLTLMYGLRIDMPVMPTRPDENLDVQRLFGKSTNTVPTQQLLFSPRMGFRWQSGGERITQIRGGMGLFLGRPPFVWLSNAYANTGLRTSTLVCDGGRNIDDNGNNNRAPFFLPGEDPTQCVSGTPGAVRRAVTVFDENFRFPQDIKVSLGIDRQITDDLSASVGFLFSRALNQVFVEDINLGPAVTDQQHPAYTLGFGGRPNFGVPNGTGYAPVRLNPEYAQVLQVTNRSDDYAYSFSGEVRGRLTDRIRFQAGYAYARSYDRASLTHNDMLSNFGTNAVQGHPNRPELEPSRFDRPHKFVLAMVGNPIPGVEGTEVALLYTGESGLPYSYVYRGDLNGDGYPGFGPGFDRNNDLLYVPLLLSETPMTGLASTALFGSAIATDECLTAYAGSTIPRNACRSPWQNRLDLRVSHSVLVGNLDLSLQADLINLLNFVNSDWGLVRRAPSTIPVLESVVRDPLTQILYAGWAGGVSTTRDSNGEVLALDPFTTASPASQWQAQLGLKVTWR
jgi:carboxypeptidase family protein